MNVHRIVCLLLLIPLAAGCYRSERTELLRTRAELEKAKAEILDLQMRQAGQSVEPTKETASANHTSANRLQPSNQEVAQQIGAALTEAHMDGYDIQIRFQNGVALLDGRVGTQAESAKATQIVQQVPGVRSVTNRLQCFTNYLEELERLSRLLEKKALTTEEFQQRKQAILDRQKASPATTQGPVSTIDGLAQQFRDLESLYRSTTISLEQRDAKKAQLIAFPLTTIEMRKDLETVKGLYSESIISLQEHEALKQKILELESKPH